MGCGRMAMQPNVFSCSLKVTIPHEAASAVLQPAIGIESTKLKPKEKPDRRYQTCFEEWSAFSDRVRNG